MNISVMSVNEMKSSLRSAERMGNLSLVEMIKEKMEMISQHRGHSVRRGGKRVIRDRDDD